MPPPSLSTIPQEMLDSITSFLTYASTLALTMTSREFQLKVRLPKPPPPPTPPPQSAVVKKRTRKTTTKLVALPPAPKPYTMLDLLDIERWECYDSPPDPEAPTTSRDYFACYRCLKIRSSSRFRNSMMQGSKGKQSETRDKRFRYCISCGVDGRQPGYTPGSTVAYGGSRLGLGMDGGYGWLGVVCFSCKTFKTDRCNVGISGKLVCWGCSLEAERDREEKRSRWSTDARMLPERSYRYKPTPAKVWDEDISEGSDEEKDEGRNGEEDEGSDGEDDDSSDGEDDDESDRDEYDEGEEDDEEEEDYEDDGDDE